MTPRFQLVGAALLAIGLAVAFGPAMSQAEGDGATGSLRGALGTLADAHDIAIQGLETVDDEPAPAAHGTTRQRVETLLGDYNYLLVRRPGGGVESVVIMGRKTRIVAPPDVVEIATARRGAHHLVVARLQGPDGAPVEVEMIVDTGASMIVLPSSLIAPLGFDEDALADGLMETANRRVRGKRAVLASVTVGAAIQRDVAVAFIDDDRIGDTMLLGMSFLRRYRMTIDDTENKITLSGAR